MTCGRGGIKLEQESEVKCNLHMHVFLWLCVAAMHGVQQIMLPPWLCCKGGALSAVAVVVVPAQGVGGSS